MCKKIKLDDELQLSLMMTKIIEITFWVGCICKKDGENKYSEVPSDVFLRRGTGAETARQAGYNPADVRGRRKDQWDFLIGNTVSPQEGNNSNLQPVITAINSETTPVGSNQTTSPVFRFNDADTLSVQNSIAL